MWASKRGHQMASQDVDLFRIHSTTLLLLWCTTLSWFGQLKGTFEDQYALLLGASISLKDGLLGSRAS